MIATRVRSVALSVFVALAAALVGPGVSAAAADTTPVVGARVGVNPGSGILWESDADRQDDLDAIAATGAHWVSIDIDWNSIQPDAPDGYDWSVPDRVVREAHVRGLAIIGMVAYSPPWARPASCPDHTSHCLPERPEDYARFAKAAALRYGANAYDESFRGAIGIWQIWNEPNHVPFVQPRVDVARYTELLVRAYAEIKKVDRTSVVLAAGTAPAPDDPSGKDMAPMTFLEGIYAHGGGDAFDAFAHHPYSYPCNPLINKQWNAFFQTYWLHQALVRHGDGDRTIWGTESGAPTGGDVGGCGDHDGVSVSEADQARFAVDALRGWTQTFGRFTGPLLWFQIRDASTDPERAGDHFGLVRHDFSPKPAAAVFSEFLTRPDIVSVAPRPPPPPEPVPDPVPDPAPDPPPVPVPDPVAVGSECAPADATVRLTGSQTDRSTPVFDTAATVDARTARWTQVDPWPVSVTGSGPVCWSGGVIVGTYSADTTWDTFHSTGAFNVANPNSVIENLRVHNYGDGIRLRNDARNWRIRGADLTDIHDDCVEDDKLHSGVITDSLFDGCYVGISTRPTASDSSSDGHRDTLVLDGSLLRLQPMPTVYKGSAPGHGGFFKWETDEGRSPRLVVRNDVFRVDQPPNHGTLGLPDGYEVQCSGNTIVWLGDGPFPGASSWLAQCPDTRIVTSRSVWDEAVAAWHVAHAR